jgi:hypothetical protein
MDRLKRTYLFPEVDSTWKVLFEKLDSEKNIKRANAGVPDKPCIRAANLRQWDILDCRNIIL